MKLISASQESEYDRAVGSLQSGSFLQSWEWGEWQACLGREVYRFKIQDAGGNAVGAVLLVKTPLPFGRYYLYAPYGPVIDSKFGNEDLRNLIQEIKNKFSDALFLRLEPRITFNFKFSTLNLPIVKSANIQPGKTLVLDLDKSEGQLFSAMRQKTRYNIRLAQKHGVAVEKDPVVTPGHGLYFREAVELIVETAARQGYRGHSKKYYENLVDFFAKKNQAAGGVVLSIYKTLYHSRLLASAIMLDFGNTRTYLFGGSSEKEKQVMAPYALHWQAIMDAKALGLGYYDFWGLETSGGVAAGFARFKLGFGGQILEYAGAYDVPSSKTGYAAYRLARIAGKFLGR